MGRIVRFEPDNSRHRAILNGGLMQAYISSLGAKVMAGYTATTTKRTGANASRVSMQVSTNGSYLNDRATATVKTWGAYNLQRELGGERNSVPEMTLMRALRLAGGDTNYYVTPGTYVAQGEPRRGKVKSFVTGGR